MSASKEEVTTFTLRVKSSEYAIFAALCALKGTTVTDVLRGCVASYIDENKALINLDALKASEAKK